MLNKKEIAIKCRVSEVTIDRWRKIGFPSHKPNDGIVLFDELEVKDWLKERDRRLDIPKKGIKRVKEGN